MVSCLKRLYFVPVCVLVYLFISIHAHAATLGSVSDTLTTSRPSASTPLSADAASSVGQVSVYNNGSIFLASDSARLLGGTAENATVATVSAARTTVFFTTNTANAHTNGTVLIAPITATHTIKFTTISSIPSTGSIILTFPSSLGTDTNFASPSAATFMPNGLTSGNIKSSVATLTCTLNAFSAGNAPTITCNNATSAIAGGTTITILLGCSAGTTSCTTQQPTLINPTKTAAAGTADTWTLNIASYDAASGAGNQLDTSKIKIGTVESINVVAHIESYFTFSITGAANALVMNTVCTDGGNDPNTTNTGFPTTSTDVNLGTLTSSATNVAAQKMVITSNSVGGYTITATSSGHLINPANGVFLQDAQGTPTNNDTPAPASIANGGNKFGIRPCDLSAQAKVNTTTWGSTTPLFANPSAAFYYTLVNSGSAPASAGDTYYVEYAATPGSNTAPGDYRTQLTYVATVTF